MNLSLGVKSAFMKMLGWDISLRLLESIDDTLEDLVILTRMGLERSGWHFLSR